ncbi:MAG: type III pantothenate kinase [Balneolaceae bacterium]
MSGYLSGLMGFDPGRGLYLDIGNSRITIAEPGADSSLNAVDEPSSQAVHTALPADTADNAHHKYTKNSDDSSHSASSTAVPKHWTILESIPVSSPISQSAAKLIRLLQNQPPDRLIIASTVRRDIEHELSASLPDRIHWIGRTSFRSFIAMYETPDTLGLDRILTAWGAWLQYRQSAVIIDCGTACTIDAVVATTPDSPTSSGHQPTSSEYQPITNSATFAGGVIMPGIHTLHEALRHATPELPGVPLSIPQTFPGKSTQSCLEWGINGLFTDGVLAHIQRYRSWLGDIPVLLTGGDAELLSNWLSGFGVMGLITDPYLIYKGMSQLPEHL